MLDIKLIRENPDFVRQRLATRGAGDEKYIEEVVQLDEQRRKTLAEVEQLKAQARERLGILHERGVSEARLYGVDDNMLEGGLNSFFLLLDEPEVYNLPQNPPRPSNNVAPASFWTIVAAMVLGLLGILFFRE